MIIQSKSLHKAGKALTGLSAEHSWASGEETSEFISAVEFFRQLDKITFAFKNRQGVDRGRIRRASWDG